VRVETPTAPGAPLDVYVRQSWLKEAFGCPEKARRKLLYPDWASRGSEYTSIGTGVHTAIELLLWEPDAGVGDVLQAAYESFDQAMAESSYTYLSRPDECYPLIRTCLEGFDRDLRSKVEGKLLATEWQFQIPLFSYLRNPGTKAERVVNVWGEGTVDCITDLQLWDWKTAGKSSIGQYKGSGKQASDVQFTMYGAATAAAGFLEWPILGTFAVMNRSDGSTLLCDVDRTESHVKWMMRQIKPFVEMALDVDPEREWPMNDQYEYCGRWCPFYSVCRGCYDR